MVLTREQLYEVVWSGPMIKVAPQYKVSGSFLARVCRQLKVPHPPRGYWAKVAAGERPSRPPLPAALPGDALEWNRDRYGLPRSLLPVPTAPAPDTKARRTSVPNRHPLVRDVQVAFEKVRKSSISEWDEYLRPYKQALPDILVSPSQLVRALDTANALYLAFERRGFRVTLPGDFGTFSRSAPDLREGAKERGYPDHPWGPHKPTLVFIGSVAIGLTVYERAENVEVENAGGKRIRVADLPPPPPRRRSAPAPYTWKSFHYMPTGRLVVRAYSPYPRTAWSMEWRESRSGSIVGLLARVRREVIASAPRIAELAAVAHKQALEERARLEAQERAWRREEAERRRKEAIKASTDQLMSIIGIWTKAVGIEQFFEQATRRADALRPEERAAVARRIAKARELVGDLDPTRYLSAWRSPAERLAASAGGGDTGEV